MGKNYLLEKRGLYYRPDNAGYTGIKEHAGRYLAADAEGLSNVTAIHEDQAPEYSKGCWHDVKYKDLLKRRTNQSHAIITRLIGYAEHDDECAKSKMNSNIIPCTCGYSAAIADARDWIATDPDGEGEVLANAATLDELKADIDRHFEEQK